MKKIIAAMLMCMMVLSLAGCGKTGIAGAANDWVTEDDDIEAYKYEDGTYLYEGKIGSTMKTQWFDFTVNDAYYTEDSIGGYSPSDGNVLVVVDLTLKNTFTESIPMWDDDFIVLWGDDEYTYPVEVSEPLLDEQLPFEFDMKVDEKVNGVLVFEAPAGDGDYSIAFVEYYEDDTEGDAFRVYFTAEEK